MKIIFFSGQKGFIEEITKLINERGLQNVTLVVESAGSETKRLAKHYYEKGAQIFVARGQNYHMLREQYDIPVINVKCTYEEILIAYNHVPKSSQKIAIVGYGSVFKMIKKFKRISGNPFCPIEIENVENMDSLIYEAAQRGIDTFIGGIKTKEACEKYGLNHVMLDISPDSLETALFEATHLLNVQAERNKNYHLIQTLLNSTNDAVISFNKDKSVSYVNTKFKQLIHQYSRSNLIELILSKKNFHSVFELAETIENDLVELSKRSFSLSIKPLIDDGQVHSAVATLKSADELISSENSIRKQLNKRGHVAKNNFKDILGNSFSIKNAIEWAKKFSVSDNTVLIIGESGTGKELFAQSMHNYSPRRNGPFIAINCAALSSSVLESELFGYVEGAFTGASKGGKMGIFELAHNGTVFLDEIGEIDANLQAKLLRVLQEKEVLRVGGEDVIPVNVRFISATNRNLKQLVSENKFRKDLFYRLAVLELKIPALSERKDDIPLIISSYISNNYPNMTIDQRSLDYFKSYNYDGNIRHLINIIERCVVMSPTPNISLEIIKEVCMKEFGENKAENISTGSGQEILLKEEKKIIEQLLKKNDYSRKSTANELGISTTTLWRKLKKYDLL